MRKMKLLVILCLFAVVTVTVSTDTCASNPCLNNGQCSSWSGQLSFYPAFYCTCNDGYFGNICQFPSESRDGKRENSASTLIGRHKINK
ncbi:lactadherin-like [Amphiura filiformis]|uniref:lactadherin-like n=1 Tax=Amphiura filiformis TaxID=82378 RepID=UPI003B21080C